MDEKQKYTVRAEKQVLPNGRKTSLTDLIFKLFLGILLINIIGVIRAYQFIPQDNPLEVVFPGWYVNDKVNSSRVEIKSKDINQTNKSKLQTKSWPVSALLKREFETIKHPADDNSEISVPKFYADHVTDGRLMTKAEADKIGIKIPLKLENGKTYMMPTIYVAIAAYRDWQCRYTVESIFSRAKYPERIRVAVVDQIEHGKDDPCDIPIKNCEEDPNQALCKFRSQIDVFEMEAALSVGPVFARHIGHRMYRGEYFTLQSDAHVTFTKNWDVDIINQFIETRNEMAVLSTYLSDIQGSIDDKTGNSLRHTRPIMCNTDYEHDTVSQHLRHGAQPEADPVIRDSPQLDPYWAAGFSFARGHWILNVPYDQYQPMIFQGEEISITVRGFTWGYDFYSPVRSVCFHMYAVGVNQAKRKKVALFWENEKLYRGKGKEGMKRLLGIIGMNKEGTDEKEWNHTDEEKYGLGKVRMNTKFFETFGIHTKNQTVEHHLCRFVASGQMHNEFRKFLRSDKMGIDYDRISFKFTDPIPNKKIK